jgi:IclR family mhp operon transcriptional activator
MERVSTMEATYKTVRALERGLDLIIELNSVGRARPAQLSATTGIDRTTVYRLLQTLSKRGLVAKNSEEDSYYLLREVRRLSDGFTETDNVIHVAKTQLAKLLPAVQWPSDFATFDRGFMVIRETTHRLSAVSTHRAMVGRRRAVMNSALGRAMLLAASPEQREMMLQITESILERPIPRNLDDLLDDFAKRGYAWSIGGSEPNISGIALPVHGANSVVGAVNIVFFRRASTPEQIAEKYLGALKSCVAAIEDGIRNYECR